MPHPDAIWPYALSSAGVGGSLLQHALVHAYTHSDFSLSILWQRGAAQPCSRSGPCSSLAESPQHAAIVGHHFVLIGLLVVASGQWRSQRQGRLTSRGNWALRSARALVHFHLLLRLTGGCASHGSCPLYGAGFRLDGSLRCTVCAQAIWLPGMSMAGVAEGLDTYPRRWYPHAVDLHAGVAAYTMAPVSYVGALREVQAFVLAALAGWCWLGEAFGVVRHGRPRS